MIVVVFFFSLIGIFNMDIGSWFIDGVGMVKSLFYGFVIGLFDMVNSFGGNFCLDFEKLFKGCLVDFDFDFVLLVDFVRGVVGNEWEVGNDGYVIVFIVFGGIVVVEREFFVFF